MDWVNEIVELHDFFEAYFLAREDSTERVEVALADAFTMIGPDGSIGDRSETLAAIRGGHGHSESLTITTSDHTLVAQTDELVVAHYIEHHAFATGSNRRRTTVVFTKAPDAPNGVQWLHAQETFA